VSERLFVIWLVALLAVVASGVQVAFETNESRKLHLDLELAQRARDEAAEVQSRLLIERATLGAYANVEAAAQARLDMRFPETIQRVDP
jgi:cell division protein FtsL